jgi:hypothetical protein
MRWVQKETLTNWASVWDWCDRMLYAIWTCGFPVKIIFPFPASAQLVDNVMTNRQCRDKMFLSIITPLIYDTSNRLFEKVKPGGAQKNLVRLIYSRINYCFANILAQTCYFRLYYWAILSFWIFTPWTGKADPRGEIRQRHRLLLKLMQAEKEIGFLHKNCSNDK